MISSRHRATALAAMILLLATAPAAHADTSLFFGFDFPTGKLSDATTAGWCMGGHMTRHLSPTVEVGGIVAYNDFVVDTTAPGAGARFGPTMNTWEIEALGQIELGPVQGFVGLGLASYVRRDDAGDDVRQTGFAWQVGVARQLDFLDVRLGFHQIDAENAKPGWIGLTFGVLL